MGRHPRVNWGELSFGDEVPRPEPGAGVGLKTGAHPLGSDVFVVDLDSDEALEIFETMGGAPDTFTVATSRGYHLYFRHPGFHVKTCAGDLGRGIDIRGDGGIVVAPGSPHRSGATYTAINELPLADAPEWLLEWLRAQKAPSETQHYPGDVSGEERARRRELYAEYLRNEAPPCVKGQAGDQTLFPVVQRGAYDLALPVDDVLELLREHYDPRCSPPWGAELEERVLHKAHDAKTGSSRPRAEPLPADLVHLASASSSVGHELFPDTTPLDDGEDPLEKSLKITWGAWDTPMPPPVYIISPIVPEATLGVIVAKGSSLKTWLALSMLAAVARGEPWLGHYPAEKAPTLLVDFESGRDTIQERMQYLRLGASSGLGHADFPHARLDDPKFWITLHKIVVKRGIRFVAIDSFAAGATGVDENDPRAALPLQYASRFIIETKCAVLLIHHAKKGESGDERDLMRGSSAIYGAADWACTMIPQDDDRTKMLVRNIKAYRRRPDDFAVVLTVDGLVLDVSAPTEQDAAKSDELQREIVATLARGPVANVTELNRKMGKKSGTAKAGDLDALVVRREVVKIPGQGFTLDNPVARRERILVAGRMPRMTTPQILANAAHVDVEEVHALITAGEIFSSATGLVSVVPT
jgi:hypothetical protein